jgi:hypothetical protein
VQYNFTVPSSAVYYIAAVLMAVVLRCTAASRKYGNTVAASILQLPKKTTVFAVF